MQATKRSLTVGILFLVIFTANSFAQTQATDNVNATPLFTQREHYYVRAYLTGEGVPSVMAVDVIGKDLLNLLQNLQKKQPNATLIIESVKYMAKDGSVSVVKDLPYSFNENMDSSTSVSPAVREIYQLKTYRFVNSNVYFSGEGFTNVIGVAAKETDKLFKLYDRSAPGTSIVLDGCVYKKTDGTLSAPMSKTIKLQ